MADHQEMIHAAAAAAATGTTSHHGHSVDWWTTAVSCSPDHQLPAGWSGPADGNSSRSGNAASSESPGSNSFATGVSSVTFQESAGVPGPAAVVPQPVAAGGTFATDWSHPYYFDGSGFHGHMSSRNDQGHMNVLSLTSPSSNNSPMMPQDPHEQNHQFLSNLGLELLSSPTSPSPGFQSSTLLKSLIEPAASAKPLSGFQQYQQQKMDQVPADSIREALQFSNSTPFWNPSPGFGSAEGLANLGAAKTIAGAI
ncbi:hypothetical protein PR202_gb28647 [Eleusine coracana subsp. coracana]|uniref:Uncharacterized protein n=1 Tax=Eleusine coracana subsp. coracana TaxID=191504 RepID=A0AAV5FY24_ELECO|nr:hypothetical protein PR202_gb28647 [Eleusine coracana subsp. coracana]